MRNHLGRSDERDKTCGLNRGAKRNSRLWGFESSGAAQLNKSFVIDVNVGKGKVGAARFSVMGVQGRGLEVALTLGPMFPGVTSLEKQHEQPTRPEEIKTWISLCEL